MLQIEYTALRSLKSGHTAQTLYIINTELFRRDRTFKTIGDQAVSLSGNTVTTVHRREETYNLTTQIVTDLTVPDNADMIEFLDSVASGETFRLDLTGTLENYIMFGINRAYRATRLGFNDIFRYSFQVRKL